MSKRTFFIYIRTQNNTETLYLTLGFINLLSYILFVKKYTKPHKKNILRTIRSALSQYILLIIISCFLTMSNFTNQQNAFFNVSKDNASWHLISPLYNFTFIES